MGKKKKTKTSPKKPKVKKGKNDRAASSPTKAKASNEKDMDSLSPDKDLGEPPPINDIVLNKCDPTWKPLSIQKYLKNDSNHI